MRPLLGQAEEHTLVQFYINLWSLVSSHSGCQWSEGSAFSALSEDKHDARSGRRIYIRVSLRM